MSFSTKIHEPKGYFMRNDRLCHHCPFALNNAELLRLAQLQSWFEGGLIRIEQRRVRDELATRFLIGKLWDLLTAEELLEGINDH